jgi:Holliday junction resolvase
VADGLRRERQVRAILEADDWVCVRAAGSLGPADLIALKRGMPPRFVQVKTDRDSPYKNFGPAARLLLTEAADRAGAEAWLVWWPARRPLAWVHADAWPGNV